MGFEKAYLVALLPLLWCFLTWLLARMSGWSQLAKRFPATAIHGESARLRSGRIGSVSYHSCLSFRVNEDGLRISVALPLRVGHSPMFIPWTAFHRVREDGRLYSQKIRVSVGRPTIAQVTLPGWVRYRMPLEMRPPSSTFRN